jgi:hypothetical protein
MGSIMRHNSDAQILHVYERWHQTVVGRDLDGLMALYAEDAILETPLILATLTDRTEGISEAGPRSGRSSKPGFANSAMISAAGTGPERSFPTAAN